MKLISKFALAIALSATAFGSAAVAKDKDEKAAKPAAAPKLKLSPEFSKAADPVIKAINAKISAKDEAGKKAEKQKNYLAGKAAFPAAVAAIKNDDDKFQAANIAINLAIELQDPALQRQSVDLYLASTTTPAGDRPAYEFQKGLFAAADKDYALAEQLTVGSYNAGYRRADAEVKVSQIFSAQKKYGDALTWIVKGIDAAKATNKPIPADWYRAAFIYSRDLKQGPGIIQYGLEMVRTDPNSATYHDGLLNFINYSEFDSQEALDVYRLARQTKSLRVVQEYNQYLENLDANRYPGEAVALIDEGYASGLISKNNTTFAKAYADAKAAVAVLEQTREQDTAAAKNDARGYPAALQGDALLSLGRNAEAIELYNIALQKGNLVDKEGKDQTNKIRMHLGIAKARSGDWAGAKAEMAKVQGNRKSIADFWTVYIDQQLNPAPAKAPAAG